MTISVMLYGSALGLLLAGAAHFLDLGIRAFGRPTRWIWALAMAGIALLPLVTTLVPSGSAAGSPSGTLIPLEALYGMWDRASLPESGARFVPGILNGPLLLGWMVGSCAVILLFVGTAVRLRQESRKWTPGKAGNEEFLISDGLGPAVVGLLNPRIVLPPWALSLDEWELEMVLLHEAEHRAARDPALLALAIFFVAFAPWNPALWWGLRRLRLAVEGDCDSRVLAHGVTRKRYGNLLLGVASGAGRLFPLAPALAEGGGRFLERRLRMMKTSVGKGRIGSAAAALILSGVFLALACETPTPPVGDEVAEASGAVAKFTDQSSGDELELKVTKEAAAGSVITSETGGRIRLRAVGEDGPQVPPVVYVDGVRMGSGKEAMADLNPDEIERIEVIKGSAAAELFGEDAVGGVIQIFLKKK